MCGTIIAEIFLSLSSFGEGVAVSTNIHLVILKFRKAAMLFLCVAMILTLSCPVGVCAKSDGGSDGEGAAPPDVTVYAALVLIVSSSLLLLISRRRSRR